MKPRLIISWLVLWTAALCSLWGQGWCEGVPDEAQDILIRLRDDVVYAHGDGAVLLHDAKAQVESLGVRLGRWYPSARVWRARLLPGRSMVKALEALRWQPSVVYAEPNYRREPLALIPNDPHFADQWAMEKIRMPEAWSITTGNAAMVLAVVDTGIDTDHRDLVPNLWRNPGELCGNGQDDERDGYVDDCYGINVIEASGNVFDSEGHGTSMAGIAAAVGNNAVGMAGVTWRASIMAIRFLGPSGGTVADFLEALEFGKNHGVRVMNLSFGSRGYSQAEKDALASSSNILFVAAAGNNRSDNDLYPLYPASYSLPNLIAVAASDAFDRLASFSNCGISSVHLAAPGTDILGPVPGNGYESGSGTSAATAMVSGAAALLLSVYPGLPPLAVKERLLRTVDIPDTALKVITGGRLNVYRAITAAIAGPFIYRIVPDAAAVGFKVTIYGASFGNSPGIVHFSGGVVAEVLSWSNEEITVRVPEGAVSGPVWVETGQGISPEVPLTVSRTRMGARIWFPEVKVKRDHKPVLVVSNPLPQTLWVTIALMESTVGEVTLKRIALGPLEKRFLWIEEMVPVQPPPSLMVGVFSEFLVPAAVVSTASDFSQIQVMPHVVDEAARP